MLRAFHLVLPKRKCLNQYPGIQQDIESDIRHLKCNVHTLSVGSSQHYGDIRVTLRSMHAASAATKQDCMINAVTLGHQVEKNPRRIRGLGINFGKIRTHRATD